MKKEVDRLSIRKYVNFYEKVRNFLKTVKSRLLAALLRYVFSYVYKFLKSRCFLGALESC